MLFIYCFNLDNVYVKISENILIFREIMRDSFNFFFFIIMIKYLFYFKIYIININQNCFVWICKGNFDLWLLWFFRVFQKMGIDNKGCVILLLVLYLYVIVQMYVFLLMLNWVYVLLLFQKIDKWRLLFCIVFFFVFYIDFCVVLYFFYYFVM